MNARTIRFEQRLTAPRWLAVGVPVTAFVIAFVITAVLLVVTGHDPLDAYRKMIEASVTRRGALSATLITATPLLLTGLAAAIAFRMRVWNIGGEGQLYVGAIAAAGAGLLVGDQGLAVALPVMCVAGMLGGALWAAVPGVLRAYWSTNEILTSLMLNYVGSLFMYYLVFGSRSFWRDPSPSAQTFPRGKPIADGSWWPGFVFSDLILPLGFALGVVCAVLLFVAIRSTRFGFRLRLVSDSPRAALYSGVRTKRTLLVVMLLSGALAGLAGASQIGDFTHALDPKGLSAASYGYTGIVVAALVRYNALGVVVAALFMGALSNAGLSLAGSEFPQGLVGMTQGVILFCALGGELLSRYRIQITHSAPRARTGSVAATSGGGGDDRSGGES